MSDDRLQRLIAALDNPQTRDQAIHQLSKSDDPAAVAALGRLIRSGDGGDAMAYLGRRAAVEALVQIGGDAAIPHIIVALEDDHAAVRMAAAHTLAGLPSSQDAIQALVDRLDDENADVREATVTALGRLQADVATALIPHLADSEDSVRDATTTALSALGAVAFDDLLAALDDANSTIRGGAADLLGELGDDRAREKLMVAFREDSSRWVRSRADAALGKLPGGKPDIALKDDPERNIPTPKDALDHIRKQRADWSKLLGRDRDEDDAPDPDPDDMTADDIRAMLDQLDVRLINGEISEATYHRLVERWQNRLDALD